MSYQYKGDVNVKRTLVADRRVDTGLKINDALMSDLALVRHSASWQRITQSSTYSVHLPDPTTLPLGWEVVVEAITGTTGFSVKTYMGSTTLKAMTEGQAYKFTLIATSPSEEWRVTLLSETGSTSSLSSYTYSHNKTTDWTDDTAGSYYIVVAQATHGMLSDIQVQCFQAGEEGSGSGSGSDAGYYYLTTPDEVIVQDDGDVQIKVPSDPDLRYFGRIVIQGNTSSDASSS